MTLDELRAFPHRAGIIAGPDWIWLKVCRAAGTSIWRTGMADVPTLCCGANYQPDAWQAWYQGQADPLPYTWTVVRHPFDRLLSCLGYFHIDPVHFADNPLYYVHRRGLGLHMLSQIHYARAADQVWQFERLSTDWRWICDRIGIKYAPLPKTNASRHPSIAPGTVEKLQRFVAADVEALQDMGIDYA